MSDFLAAIGCDDSFYDAQGIDRKYQYVYLVDATFWFDGDNDPLNNVVDLTSFKLVGDDYYCDFSFEVNSLAGVNPVLEGNSMFSIGSGKRIGLQMPFLVDSSPSMALQKTIFCHTHQSLWFHSTRMRCIYRCQQQIADNTAWAQCPQTGIKMEAAANSLCSVCIAPRREA